MVWTLLSGGFKHSFLCVSIFIFLRLHFPPQDLPQMYSKCSRCVANAFATRLPRVSPASVPILPAGSPAYSLVLNVASPPPHARIIGRRGRHGSTVRSRAGHHIITQLDSHHHHRPAPFRPQPRTPSPRLTHSRHKREMSLGGVPGTRRTEWMRSTAEALLTACRRFWERAGYIPLSLGQSAPTASITNVRSGANCWFPSFPCPPRSVQSPRARATPCVACPTSAPNTTPTPRTTSPSAAQGENMQIVSGGEISGVTGMSCSSPIFASVSAASRCSRFPRARSSS
ncbi:hypothetical protein B0H14DRAFT_3176119, partial [Mycena olivaceomarginata]